MIETPQHDISVLVDGIQIREFESYAFTSDMLRASDSFSIRIPFNREVWDLCREDSRIRVLIDNTCMLNGFIDERLVPEDDEMVEVVGRDIVGRLIQESAPGFSYAGFDVFDLIRQAADPWFKTVTFSNARNRKVMRGRGLKAKAAGEPLKLHGRKKTGTRIEPGQTRWHVIETLCAQAGYLCWSSGDGKELIVGKPNYDQELQYRFFMPAKGSARESESTVRGMGVRRSVADRYSQVIVVGSGVGTDANYGTANISRAASAKNNPLTPDGDGEDFTEPKRLILQREVASHAEAQELADREMAQRDAKGDMLTVRCAGHGQVIAGAYTTLFAPDTLASVEDERTGTKGTYLITACTYRSARQGEETLMTLVRRGAELVA